MSSRVIRSRGDMSEVKIEDKVIIELSKEERRTGIIIRKSRGGFETIERSAEPRKVCLVEYVYSKEKPKLDRVGHTTGEGLVFETYWPKLR